jgi:hypothetical protein
LIKFSVAAIEILFPGNRQYFFSIAITIKGSRCQELIFWGCSIDFWQMRVVGLGFFSTLEISIYSQMFDYSNIAFCLFREPDKGIKNKFLKTILAEASDHRGNVQKG